MMAKGERAGRSGMTLIEICVAVGILAFCFLPIMQFSQSNLRETQVSQEDLLARHFLIDMVETLKDEQAGLYAKLPPTEIPVVLGEDLPVVAGVLKTQDEWLKQYQQTLASDPNFGGATEGMQAFSDMKKTMQVSRSAILRPAGAPITDQQGQTHAVNELVCIVRFMSSITKQEKRIEFSKIIVQ